MGQRTAGDEMFEAYLVERGYDVPEHEPALGVRVRPEYLVELDGARCLTEVKEFAPDAWPLNRGSGTYSQQETLKPIRGQIHEAARKLREARALGYPLVVVLTDPHRSMSGLFGSQEIVAAMAGDLAVRVPVSARGPVGPTELAATRNGELRNDHPYVSAVVVIRERSESEHFAETFVTHSPDAIPLPPVFFRGPDDLVFE